MLKRLMSGVLSLVMLGTMFPTVKTTEQTQSAIPQTENPVNSPMDYQISSTNSLGNYINDMVEKQNMLNASAAEVPQDERFMVNNLEFDNETGKLTVKSTQTSDSSVVIRFIDEESGKTIIEKSAEAASGESVATVFDIDKTKLSEFYIISAVLVDEKGNEICKAFEYKKYTKEIQKVIASDIHDFKEEQVIQLDKSEDTNFVVLSEDTIKAESNAEKNVLLSADYDNGVFVFENPDDTIKNLKSGESFYIQPNENDLITIIVGTVEINGNQATLRASDEPIDDMFDFIKLEATSDQSGMMIDTSKADESLQFGGFENDGLVHEFDSCEPITFESILSDEDHLEDSITVNVQKREDNNTNLLDIFSGSIEIGYTLDYYKSSFELMIDFELTATSSVTIEVGPSFDFNRSLPSIDLGAWLLPTPIPGIVIDLTPSIEFELSATLSFTFSEEVMVGFKYDDTGFQEKSDTSDGPCSFEAKGEASIKLNFNVGFSLIDDDIANVRFVFSLGFLAEATPTHSGPSSNDSNDVSIIPGCSDNYVHACMIGIDGTLKFVFGFSINADLLFLNFEVPLYECPVEIGKFYYSDEAGGGWGECDYNKYRIEIKVKPGNSEYENAQVKLDGRSQRLNQLPDTAVFYGLNTGSSPGYYYSVESGGKTLKTGHIKVNNASQTITVNLDDATSASTVGQTVTTAVRGSTPSIPGMVIATAPKPNIPKILEIGTLGDNISYTLYETGELWIYGYGDMKDFSSAAIKKADKVKKVTFEHKNPKKNLYITSIGKNVFCGCKNLPEIEIPDTVTRIGDYAFCGCSALTDINIPASVQSIGAYAFKETGIINAVIPGTVTTLGDYAFSNCTSLKSATISDGVGSIGADVFDKCTAIESITLPYAGDTLASVNQEDSRIYVLSRLFNNKVIDKTYGAVCNGLTSYIPNSLKKITITGGTRIPTDAFNGFKSLTEINLPDTITSVGNNAFYGCGSLPALPNIKNVKTIGSYAFANCKSLESVTIPSATDVLGNNAFSNCTSLKTAIISDGVGSIGADVFDKCTAIESITLPYAGDTLENVNQKDSRIYVISRLFDNKVIDKTYGAVCNGLTSYIPNSLKKITITGGTRIPAEAFNGFKSLTEINLPDTITSIGNNAFKDCVLIPSIHMLPNLKAIGNNAYDGCKAITVFKVPSTVQTIGSSAFANCSGLTNVVVPKTVKTLGSYAFSNCTSLKSATISDGVGSIGEYVFNKCTAIESITLPYAGDTLENVNQEDSRIYVLSRLFNSKVIDKTYGAICNGLTSYIPNSLKKITITGGTRIPTDAFNGFKSLTEINLPDTITSVGNNAFYGCGSLPALPNIKNVKTIGSYAFANCKSLESVTIPSATDVLGNNAFSNCTSLKSATISDGVGSIGADVFDKCTAIESITLPYAGDTLKNVNQEDSRIYVVSRLFDNKVIDKTYGAICNGLTSYIPNSLKKITITGGTRIPADAFNGFKNLTEINLPDTITSIGYNAFKDCAGLERISFYGNAPSISSNAFTKVTATAYYQKDNKTWTSDVKQNYGGNITWNGVELIKITKQPTNAAAPNGKSLSVTVTAKGEGLTYKWYYKNKSMAKFVESTSTTYDTYSVDKMTLLRDGRQIYCIVTDKHGNSVTSDIVTLYIGNPVKITKQPKNVSGKIGEKVKVTVSATGDGLTYKWYYKNKGASKFLYTSTFDNKPAYTVTMDDTRDGRQIYCVITDKYGVEIKTNTVTIGLPAVITKQPSNASSAIGSTIKTTVSASGHGLTYQWYVKNYGDSEFVKSSITKKTYSYTMTESKAGREVYCVITDMFGNKVQTKTVTLKSNIKITSQPTNVSAAVGKKVSTSVTATGTDLKYQWYVRNYSQKGFYPSSITDATYEYVMTAEKSGRQAYCVITDRFGNSVTTDTVTFTKK